MSVQLSPGATFQATAPKALFRLPPGYSDLDMAPDGRRFLVELPVASGAQSPFNVVLNWPSTLPL